MQNFHNLRAWNEAHGLAIAIRHLSFRFPKSEYGSLRNQMVRAAESIGDNIAEGSGAATNAEFARFLDMAIKSSSELESQIERAHAYGLTRDAEHQSLAKHVCDVRKMTWGLRKKVLAPPPRGTRTTNDGTRVGKRITDDGRRITGRKTDDGPRTTDDEVPATSRDSPPASSARSPLE